MASQLPAGRPCATCTHWRGGAASYLGDCAHPETYFARVPFDHTCALHQAVAALHAPPPPKPQEQPPPAATGPIPVIGALRKPPAARQKPPSPRRLNP